MASVRHEMIVILYSKFYSAYVTTTRSNVSDVMDKIMDHTNIYIYIPRRLVGGGLESTVRFWDHSHVLCDANARYTERERVDGTDIVHTLSSKSYLKRRRRLDG